MIRRKENWPTLLNDYIQSVKQEPFAWGSFDCALFGCNCGKVMTDYDFAGWFRGRYQTRKGAYTALKEFSGGRLKETALQVAKLYGVEACHPNMAQRGDLVYLPWDKSESLGVIGLDGSPLFVGEKGLMKVDLDKIKLAWRIG